MSGDIITVLLILLGLLLVSPVVIYCLYVSLLNESRPKIKDLKCAILGALLALISVALVGGATLGSQSENFGEAALYGAMIFLMAFGIPSAIAGAVVGAVVSIIVRRGSRRT